MNTAFDEPVYTQLDVEDYVKRDDDVSLINPNSSGSYWAFIQFYAICSRADVYVACHYWDNRSPLYLQERMSKVQTGIYP